MTAWDRQETKSAGPGLWSTPWAEQAEGAGPLLQGVECLDRSSSVLWSPYLCGPKLENHKAAISNFLKDSDRRKTGEGQEEVLSSGHTSGSQTHHHVKPCPGSRGTGEQAEATDSQSSPPLPTTSREGRDT